MHATPRGSSVWAGNPVGSRCSTGNVGPGCLSNPSYASRPVVTVDGQCADSGGIWPESFRVSGGNMPHPMASIRAGDTLGDRGFEVTAPIQSAPPTQALRPSTVSGLASSGGALRRSLLGPGANWSRNTRPEMIGLSTPEGTGMFFNGPVVGGTGQIGSRGGYPAEHHQMTTDEHRLLESQATS